MKRLMIMGLMATLLLAPMSAFARPGFVVIHPAFGWGWGWAPYWGPYPYYGYYNYAPATGALKFDTHIKAAEVYVDGAYAGTVGKLKTMYLRPGSYDIEVRAPGGTPFDQKVYVTAGKTLHLRPELGVEEQQQKQP